VINSFEYSSNRLYNNDCCNTDGTCTECVPVLTICFRESNDNNENCLYSDFIGTITIGSVGITMQTDIIERFYRVQHHSNLV